MKSAFILLTACALAILAGGGLSFVGYEASSATVTVTSTQTFLTAATSTSGIVATTTATTQTGFQSDVLEHSYNIPSPTLGDCGTYDDAYAKLDPGKLSISFSVTGSDVVDFWVLNAEQWTTWQSINSCSGVESYPGLASIVGVNSWTTNLTVPTSGIYYFVFVNKNAEGVSISISVTEGYTIQTTEAVFSTNYSTLTSTWQTAASTASQQQAGLGLGFFVGAALLIVGGVGAALWYNRTRTRGGNGREGSEVTVEVPSQEPVVIPVSSREERGPGDEEAPNTFCPYCGRELPAGSTFCIACEKEIGPDS